MLRALGYCAAYSVHEAATRKGTGKAWDHCRVIHEVWTQALLNKTSVWIERVSSDDNISDLPSREEYDLMFELGAVWREPKVAQTVVDGMFADVCGPAAIF